MRNTLTSLVGLTGAVFLVALVSISPAGDAFARRSSPRVAAKTLRTEEIPRPLPDHEEDDLAVYVLGVIESWPAAVSVRAVPYGELSRDLAAAALHEPSADPAGDVVLLASLGYFEGGRFAASVDDGLCNDPAWRRTPEGVRTMHVTGDCDGGRARSLWQIHPIEDPASSLYVACSREKISSSRRDAAFCALSIARRSVAADGTLCGYTGESGAECPKAEERLEWARCAVREHPYDAESAR